MATPESRRSSVRRYVAVIQDSRGYPAYAIDLDPAPPEGPEPPMLITVVKADDYERLESAAADVAMERDMQEAYVNRLREVLAELVRLKDGPRDDAYRVAKDAAWDDAREALHNG